MQGFRHTFQEESEGFEEDITQEGLMDMAGNAFCSAVLLPIWNGLFAKAPLAEAFRLSLGRQDSFLPCPILLILSWSWVMVGGRRAVRWGPRWRGAGGGWWRRGGRGQIGGVKTWREDGNGNAAMKMKRGHEQGPAVAAAEG